MVNFSKLIRILTNHQIDFIIVGGFSAVLHGSSQVTRDLDICVCLTPEIVLKLTDCLKPFNPTYRMRPDRLSFLTSPQIEAKNLYLETDLGVLDIISAVDGVGEFKEISNNSITISLYGCDCKIISLDDLIKAKKVLTREKDKSTLIELKIIKEKLAAKK